MNVRVWESYVCKVMGVILSSQRLFTEFNNKLSGKTTLNNFKEIFFNFTVEQFHLTFVCCFQTSHTCTSAHLLHALQRKALVRILLVPAQLHPSEAAHAQDSDKLELVQCDVMKGGTHRPLGHLDGGHTDCPRTVAAPQRQGHRGVDVVLVGEVSDQRKESFFVQCHAANLLLLIPGFANK